MSILTHLSTIEPGDSGAWVVDSAGQLFGHIVAGDPMLGLAFIIPAYKIFDDIKNRFGEEPLLCPSPSVMQPFSAPNDGKVAEQPLLPWIQDNDWFQGKRTVPLFWVSGHAGAGKAAMMQHFAPHVNCVENNQTVRRTLSGIPGAGKTNLAHLYARHVISIGNGHLEEELTKLKDIAEMMRKQCAEQRMANILQTEEVLDERMALLKELTKLKKDTAEMMWKQCAEQRMANILQTVIQEVSDKRMAFFRGNLWVHFSIMTATSNELMPATFSTTGFCAKPPYFASIVPSIGAYNHIDGDHETNSEAADGNNCDLHSGILVWKYSPRKA